MGFVRLTKGDSKVLEQVFDPGSGPAAAAMVIDPSMPTDRHIGDAALLQQLKSSEREAVTLIEACEASPGQTKEIKDNVYRAALVILDHVISEHPEYASARNNRAQLYRWRFGDGNAIVRHRIRPQEVRREEDARRAIRDLKYAISLSSPEVPQQAVSPAQGKVLAQAYTQLGALCLTAAKDVEYEEDQALTFVDDTYSGFRKGHFEEEASRLFQLGGLYGGELAKALAVHTNPHAKLCGAIVQEAMRKELSPVYA